jgi:hypothetical protein
MSNVNRPRVEHKPCPFDGATVRDSNGQCHCRNVLYRLTHKPNLTDRKVKEITKAFNLAIVEGKSVEEARDLVSPAKAAAAKKAPSAPKKGKKTPAKPALAVVPEVAETEPEVANEVEPVEHRLVQTPVGLQCACGFEGKGTAPSIRSHVARETKSA